MIAIRQAGDAALLLDLTESDLTEGNGVARIAAAIRSAALPGVVDVVPAAAAVLVTVRPGGCDLARLAARLGELASVPGPPLPAASTSEVVIDAVYGGPDLADLAALTGLTAAVTSCGGFPPCAPRPGHRDRRALDRGSRAGPADDRAGPRPGRAWRTSAGRAAARNGSRSADRRSGLGPVPLRPGERLPVGRPRSPLEKPRVERPRTPSPGPAGLRAIYGPRDDWFSAAALATLGSASYQVSPSSDRTGLRLDGPPLQRARGRAAELPSEGMAAGSLQVTHDGQPILLLADHPTTGGYPVIAVVASADLGLAGQLRPGQRVRFAVSRPARGER